MAYHFGSEIRYSEVGADRRLTIPALVDYFQDCCVFQSESIGQGVKVLEERKRAWVLNAWQIVIGRLPYLGERVETYTIPYEFRGFLGLRNCLMLDAEGKRLAWANSTWSNIHTETGRPERLTEEDMAGYDLDSPIEMDYAPRKIALDADFTAMDPFAIHRHHLDTHQHVNNGQYVRMAADFLPEGRAVNQVRVEYKRQAVLGDVFYPFVAVTPSRILVVYQDEASFDRLRPYAVIEFT